MTVHILARCAESLHERPIKHTSTVVISHGTEEEREWRKFLDYGRPPTLPLTIQNMTVDLPGGLGDTTPDAQLIIREIENTEAEYDRILEIAAPDGETLATLPIHFAASRINHDGTGTSSRGTDPSGVLTIEFLTKTTDQGTPTSSIDVTLANLSERYVADIAPAVKFMDQFTAPNIFRVINPRIPLKRPEATVATTVRPDREIATRHALIAALATIQHYADFEIKVPDFDTVTTEYASTIIRIGHLLQAGTVATTWTEARFVFSSAELDTTAPVPIEYDEPLQVTIGERTIPLGVIRTLTEESQIVRTDIEPDGTTTYTFRPTDQNNTARLTWIRPTPDGDD